MTDNRHRFGPDAEPREDASLERDDCPACRTIYSPGRGCWCARDMDDNRRHLRPAA